MENAIGAFGQLHLSPSYKVAVHLSEAAICVGNTSY